MPESIENVLLYSTGENINFIKETQERFVFIESNSTDEHEAKKRLVNLAKGQDSTCNVIFDTSGFPISAGFAMKGKSVRARFP